jgi:putative membrane protein
MIVRGGTNLWRAILIDWPALLFFSLLSLAAEFIHHNNALAHTVLPLLPLSVLITALSMFLAFQINQCYERWWEARRLWGQLVNISRSFGRQVTTLISARRLVAIPDENAAKLLQQKLVYRHIAYVNALRICLRKNNKLSKDDWQELGSWLDELEIVHLRRNANIPTQLILLQGKSIAALVGKWTEQPILLQFDDIFKQIDDIQGGCERIKRTAFPDRFRFHTHNFVWLLAMLIPFCLIESGKHFDIIEIIMDTFLSFVFVTIERLGSELRDPFENKANDTPMSALCRAIEIDLRQQLDEDVILTPLEPKNGILM